jgi:hypothetical protein
VDHDAERSGVQGQSGMMDKKSTIGHTEVDQSRILITVTSAKNHSRMSDTRKATISSRVSIASVESVTNIEVILP